MFSRYIARYRDGQRQVLQDCTKALEEHFSVPLRDGLLQRVVVMLPILRSISFCVVLTHSWASNPRYRREHSLWVQGRQRLRVQGSTIRVIRSGWHQTPEAADRRLQRWLCTQHYLTYHLLYMPQQDSSSCIFFVCWLLCSVLQWARSS